MLIFLNPSPININHTSGTKKVKYLLNYFRGGDKKVKISIKIRKITNLTN